MNLGLYSYLGAGLAYGFLAFMLLFSLRGSVHGKLLFIAVLASACWALIAVQISLHDESYLLAYQSFEIIRYIAWYVFLIKLFEVALSGVGNQTSGYQKFIHRVLPISVGLAVLFFSRLSLFFLVMFSHALISLFSFSQVLTLLFQSAIGGPLAVSGSSPSVINLLCVTFPECGS